MHLPAPPQVRDVLVDAAHDEDESLACLAQALASPREDPDLPLPPWARAQQQEQQQQQQQQGPPPPGTAVFKSRSATSLMRQAALTAAAAASVDSDGPLAAGLGVPSYTPVGSSGLAWPGPPLIHHSSRSDVSQALLAEGPVLMHHSSSAASISSLGGGGGGGGGTSMLTQVGSRGVFRASHSRSALADEPPPPAEGVAGGQGPRQAEWSPVAVALSDEDGRRGSRGGATPQVRGRRGCWRG